MTPLLFSVIKRNTTSFLKNFILYTRLIFTHEKQNYNSQTFLYVLVRKSNKTFLTLIEQFYKIEEKFIENLRLLDSIHAGIHLNQRREKLILLVLLITELLKFALLKSLQVKSAKSKTSCNRMDTQKKSLFTDLKQKISNFQTSKRFSPEKCMV